MFRVLHDRASNISPYVFAGAGPTGVLGRGLCEVQAGPNKEKGLIMGDMTVAKEILRQLGGNKFIAITGATNFVGSDNQLSFKVGRNSSRVTHVKITLNALDLYDVEYIRVWGVKRTVIAHSDGLYFDMLRPDFTAKTGLETSLGTCGRVYECLLIL